MQGTGSVAVVGRGDLVMLLAVALCPWRDDDEPIEYVLTDRALAAI